MVFHYTVQIKYNEWNENTFAFVINEGRMEQKLQQNIPISLYKTMFNTLYYPQINSSTSGKSMMHALYM